MELADALRFYIPLFYSALLILLYLLTFYVIVRHWKTEKSSFFMMYIFEGVMNMCTYFMVFYSKKLNTVTSETSPLAFLYRDMESQTLENISERRRLVESKQACLFPPLKRHLGGYTPASVWLSGCVVVRRCGDIDFLKNFLTCMSYHMAFVQYINTSLISTNRYTVLRFLQSAEPFWKKFALPIMILAFLVPFVDTHRYFFLQTEIIFNEESGSYEFVEPMPLEDCFKYLNPTMIFCSVYSVGMNVASRMNLRTLNTHVRSKASTNFTIITLFTSVTQVLGCFLSIIRVKWPTGPIAKLLAEYLPFVSDGLTLMQPLLLFVLTSSIRGKIIAMFKRKDTSVVHVIRSASRNSN
ncbi:hypothetical protein GCK72_025978 [Caenorhabditis remanei]|uniref:Serpentine receptor class gamma n=1 Tax=Caenorhabditis remanei TaxID=31234 RepID=A0A6A5G3M5_CAERE|nr:hypothetical protein GCK72_025978 [Caenorhabditis remanei]KAF1749510.1 hypothetical protein GCK72_025978 [Caenorhabditis remanei]